MGDSESESESESEIAPTHPSSPFATPDDARRVVVALPCYNEAAAIPTVVEAWRAALPDVELVVFDNNSTDGTGTLARSLGVTVFDVPEQGKGHVVRAIFRQFPEKDAIVLADGDGTYPPDHALPLIALVLEGQADMAVGARRPVEGVGAMSPIRSLGNRIIPAVFLILIGPGNTDLLSGYRVFGRRYREMVRLRSSGFEIETELAVEAVARGLKVVEIPVPYYPRITGTHSKLNAFRDGRRILWTIVVKGAKLRPWRLLFSMSLPMGLFAWGVGSQVLLLASATLAVAATALAAWAMSKATKP